MALRSSVLLCERSRRAGRGEGTHPAVRASATLVLHLCPFTDHFSLKPLTRRCPRRPHAGSTPPPGEGGQQGTRVTTACPGRLSVPWSVVGFFLMQNEGPACPMDFGSCRSSRCTLAAHQQIAAHPIRQMGTTGLQASTSALNTANCLPQAGGL